VIPIEHYPRQESNNLPETREKAGIAGDDSAESSALLPGSTPIDHELQRVLNAWPMLPEAIRAGILAMIQTSSLPSRLDH
jgi:hypothetical protein